VNEPNIGKPSATSPYVSLREAVRPAIFAYGILAAERERAGELAEECDNLLQLTRELLKKSALAHLLTPEPGQQIPAGADGGDRQARLLEAYADAGMLWAKVVGSCMAIASVLLERGEWTTVNHLAEVLAAAGETASANELSRQALSGPDERLRRIIGKFNDAMSEKQITKALDLLLAVPMKSPVRSELGPALTSICRSIVRLFPEKTRAGFPNIKYYAQNPCLNKDVNAVLPNVSREFDLLR
jgi:hypothetical protein